MTRVSLPSKGDVVVGSANKAIACSSPDSDQSKSSRVSPSSTDLAVRSETPGSNRPKLSFKTVAQGIIRLLALRGQKSDTEGVV
jgi:hypothetical protein